MPSQRNLTVVSNTATLPIAIFEDPADGKLVLALKDALTGIPVSVSYNVVTNLPHTGTSGNVRSFAGQAGDVTIQVNLTGEGVSMTGTITTSG